MSVIFTDEHGALRCRFNSETLRIEGWGPDSLRLRGTVAADFRDEALSALLAEARREGRVTIEPGRARIENGRLACEAWIAPTHGEPKQELNLRFVDLDSGKELLAERRPHFVWPPARHYKAESAATWQVETTFRAHDDERFWGLGQRQHGLFDQKGCVLPMLQDNSEVNIPLAISSRGYAFLWNNPGVGRIEFGRSLTRWRSECARQLDYWVSAGKPAEVLRAYADATGHAPAFPHWATGFWQSRLRYRNQQELLAVAHEHKRRGLPMACIVVDFFHWTRHGDWKFDPRAWPDPDGMVRELRALGIEVMVSIWPTVNLNYENAATMMREGWLVRADRGMPAFKFQVDSDTGGNYRVVLALVDPTNPDGRAYMFDVIRRNYIDHGIRAFWLDSCEPDCRPTHPDLMRFHLGGGMELINAYPLFHVRGFWEGMQALGEKEPMFLCRSAWAGSQRYGALVWSGDIPSTFASFRSQIRAGLNIGLSGIGWWTTDIGGFFEGNGESPEFRELLVRWFQWGAFCPVFRLHGFRVPNAMAKQAAGDVRRECRHDHHRHRRRQRGVELRRGGLRHPLPVPGAARAPPAVRDAADGAIQRHRRAADAPAAVRVPRRRRGGGGRGLPHVRARPAGGAGDRLPGLGAHGHLPAGADWRCAWTGQAFQGGQRIVVAAPLERIPLFLRDGAELPILAA